jgi:hypothetical protein
LWSVRRAALIGPSTTGPVDGHSHAELSRRLAEECHDPVAQELVHPATVLVHDPQHHVEHAVHDLADLLGIEPLGRGSEAGDAREKSTLTCLRSQ